MAPTASDLITYPIGGGPQLGCSGAGIGSGTVTLRRRLERARRSPRPLRRHLVAWRLDWLTQQTVSGLTATFWNPIGRPLTLLPWWGRRQRHAALLYRSSLCTHCRTHGGRRRSSTRACWPQRTSPRSRRRLRVTRTTDGQLRRRHRRNREAPSGATLSPEDLAEVHREVRSDTTQRTTSNSTYRSHSRRLPRLMVTSRLAPDCVQPAPRPS